MRRAFLILLLLIAGGGIVLLVFDNRLSPTSPPPRLPEPSDVESITAELIGTTKFVPAVPRFVVPTHYFPAVLGAMRPLERSDYPASWDNAPLGSITIKAKTGRIFEVTYCFSGKN